MLQKELLKWYGLNQRNLPWRISKDPYLIWLSEVILQQTRVQQGLPYFEKFLKKYPRVKNLAEAKETEIMKLWQGLGYYSRARNMHHTAQIIVNEYGGVFPRKYDELIRLKGIGPYTAAAIASFSADEPVAVLDGNVFRVLSRLFAQSEPIQSGAGKKIFAELAQDFLNKKNPALHNQAMMELGSLVCKPTKPDCDLCPLIKGCKAYALGKQLDFPVKWKKTEVKTLFLHYLLFKNGNEIALYQRPAGDIWHNLFDLPFIEYSQLLDTEALHQMLVDRKWILASQKPEFIWHTRHLLTHRRIEAYYYLVQTRKKPELHINEVWVDPKQLKKLAIPRLLDKFFEKLNSS